MQSLVKGSVPTVSALGPSAHHRDRRVLIIRIVAAQRSPPCRVELCQDQLPDCKGPIGVFLGADCRKNIRCSV